MKTKKHKMNQSEDQIQAEFYRTAYNKYPQIRGLLFSIPNGGSRDQREAIKFKATGLTPGAPDMLLVWPEVVPFEFKTATGTVSPAQVKLHSQWLAVGIKVNVCRSAAQALFILDGVMERHTTP